VLICADVLQITAPHRGIIEVSATTFAPVPLNSGKISAAGPKHFSNFCPQRGGVIVATVGNLVPVVGSLNSGQHLRQDPRIIVAGETSPRG